MAMDNTDYAIVGRDQDDPFNANRLRSGIAVLRREDVSTSGLGSTSGTMYLTFFTATDRLTSTQVAVPSGGTAAAATPTLVRFGLYAVDGIGNLTLIASTVNDTTVFAAANTYYSKSWSSPVTVHKGQRYALGVLVVSAAAMPQFAGLSTSFIVAATAPRICGQVVSQSDLPSSVAVGSVANIGNLVYGELRP